MCRSTFNVRTPFIGRKLLKLLLYISCLSQMEIYNHRVTILRNFILCQIRLLEVYLTCDAFSLLIFTLLDVWGLCGLGVIQFELSSLYENVNRQFA